MTEDKKEEISKWADEWQRYIQSLPLERTQVINALIRSVRNVERASTESPETLREWDRDCIREWERNYRGRSPQAVARLMAAGLIKVRNLGHVGCKDLERAISVQRASQAGRAEETQVRLFDKHREEARAAGTAAAQVFAGLAGESLDEWCVSFVSHLWNLDQDSERNGYPTYYIPALKSLKTVLEMYGVE